MANAITVAQIEKTQGQYRVQGTIALSGTYVQQASGGEVLDFTKATLPLGQTLPASQGPVTLDIQGNAGYSYEPFGALPPATALKVPISVKTAAAGTPASTELAAGAYPASITGDVIQFEACFQANI